MGDGKGRVFWVAERLENFAMKFDFERMDGSGDVYMVSLWKQSVE